VADRVHGYRDCPRAGDFTRFEKAVADLEVKVFRGNGHDSLEVRMVAVESSLESIAGSMKSLVDSEKTAISFITRFEEREKVQDEGRAEQVVGVKNDLEQSNINKTLRQNVRLAVASIFALLLVGAVGWGITIHDDRIQAQWQQEIHAEMQVKK
jgi:hypothetical protein